MANGPVWIFLARRRFAAKTPARDDWIGLDFLGFSRQNLDISMGYAESCGKKFSPALLGHVSLRRNGGLDSWVMRRDRMRMKQV
jgi:hypothetical protein